VNKGQGGGVAYVNKRVSMRHVGGQMRRPTFLQGNQTVAPTNQTAA
jgi:hypothetical protein